MSDELPMAIWRSQDFGSGIESEHERNLVDLIYTLVVVLPSPTGVPSLLAESIPNRVTRQNATFARQSACLFPRSDEDGGSWISSVRFVVR
jgi:hypothetical protein